MAIPKTLFLTPIAVSRDYSGGMFIYNMCRYFPPEALDCFATLSNIYIPNQFSADVSWLNREILQVPDQLYEPPIKMYDWLNVRSLLHWTNIVKTMDQMAEQVAKYALERKTELLWVLAGGPFQIGLALRVCRLTKIPAAIIVLDPPEFFTAALGFNRLIQEPVMDEFNELMTMARVCAVPSQAMKTDYEKKYSVPSFVFYLPIDRYVKRPARTNGARPTLTIGFGGYMQFPENLGALVSALNSVDWQIGEQQVKIKLYSVGHQSPVEPSRPENVEYCEYEKDGDAVLRLFSDMDIGYLPFWLHSSAEQELAVKYCFPTKLSLYLSAGCPVLFHGPAYSSVSSLFEKYPVGVTCDSMEEVAIVNQLTELVQNHELGGRLAGARHRALDEVYSPELHRKTFARYIGANVDELLPAPAQEAISFC